MQVQGMRDVSWFKKCTLLQSFDQNGIGVRDPRAKA